MRDGYLFQGWAYDFDEDGQPLFWDFVQDAVLDDITLWAVWEAEIPLPAQAEF